MDELEGKGETDELGADGLGAAGVADIVEWTSMVDICFERDEIAQPAKTPAAPVAEFTRPACPLPLAVEVVVIGPILADDSVCTVSGWMSAEIAEHIRGPTIFLTMSVSRVMNIFIALNAWSRTNLLSA